MRKLILALIATLTLSTSVLACPVTETGDPEEVFVPTETGIGESIYTAAMVVDIYSLGIAGEEEVICITYSGEILSFFGDAGNYELDDLVAMEVIRYTYHKPCVTDAVYCGHLDEVSAWNWTHH